MQSANRLHRPLARRQLQEQLIIITTDTDLYMFDNSRQERWYVVIHEPVLMHDVNDFFTGENTKINQY